MFSFVSSRSKKSQLGGHASSLFSFWLRERKSLENSVVSVCTSESLLKERELKNLDLTVLVRIVLRAS